MSDDQDRISIAIMGRDYKVNCPPEKVAELQASAAYLDDKMLGIQSDGKVLSMDRIAVIAALNITHDLLAQKRERTYLVTSVSDRIDQLQKKIEVALEE